MTNQAITLTRDQMVAVNVLKAQNDIFSLLTKTVEAAINMVASLNQQIFNDPVKLINQIGSVATFDMETSPNALDVGNLVRKALWAYLVLYAWAHSNEKDKGGAGIIFIM